MSVESVDKRMVRAAKESMTVVALGKDEYKVYSGSSSVYEVNLVNGTCDCPAAKYQQGPCKHVRRIEHAILSIQNRRVKLK